MNELRMQIEAAMLREINRADLYQRYAEEDAKDGRNNSAQAKVNCAAECTARAQAFEAVLEAMNNNPKRLIGMAK